MTWLPRIVSRFLAAATAVTLTVATAGPAAAQSAIRDTEIEGIIREWSDPVFTAIGLEPSEVEILLVGDNDLNAFATPGRVLGVNTGLILRTRNANELLGVIAHEAGHIKNRHTLRDGARDAGMQPMIMSMALGALAYPFFRSHPLSSARIENLRRLVSEAPHYGHVESPERIAQHALIQAKIRAFMDPPNQTLRTYPSTDTSLPGRYARAIAWYRDGQTNRALTAVDGFLAEQPDNPYFWELKGQILFEESRPVEAIEAHQRSVELMPEAPLLRINLAHALIETSDTSRLDQAVSELKRATVLEKDNTLAWRLLSQAYSSQGKEGEARLASAEFYFAQGRQDQATQFALRARDMLPRGSTEWVRAMDIVFASGATQEDVDAADERYRRDRPVRVIPADAG